VRPQRAKTEQIRIVIADDHPIFRNGLRQLLEAEHDFSVVGQASGGAQALRLTIKLQPDVLLLDASMPQMSGLEVLRRLAKIQTNTRIIIVTVDIDNSDLALAIRLGIRGVVLKQSAAQTLYDAIRAVMAGRCWMVSEIVPGGALRTSSPLPRDEYTLQEVFGLTSRELEVVRAVLSGRSDKVIAEHFSISEQTVKHHLSNIFKKLGISKRLQLPWLVNNRHIQ
jgi:two-component system nitrate/nitrite response regulator NarL